VLGQAVEATVPESPVALEPLDRGLERARVAGHGQDRLERESLEFHQRVRQGFRSLAGAAPDRYLVVDAARQPDAVASLIRVAAGKRLAARIAAQPPADSGTGRRLGWRSRRTKADHGATVAPPRPPAGSPVPPVGVAGEPAPGQAAPDLDIAGAAPALARSDRDSGPTGPVGSDPGSSRAGFQPGHTPDPVLPDRRHGSGPSRPDRRGTDRDGAEHAPHGRDAASERHDAPRGSVR